MLASQRPFAAGSTDTRTSPAARTAQLVRRDGPADGDCRRLVLQRLLEAYGHVRLDETIRQLAVDALRCDQPEGIRPTERAWLMATLEVSARQVADTALEQLADALSARLEQAPDSVCIRVAQPTPWRAVGG